MENLPREILENILFKLPAEIALQAKRVCTNWESLLRNYRSEKPGFLFALRNPAGYSLDEWEVFYRDEYEHYDHANANTNYSHYRDTLTRVGPPGLTKKDVMVGSANGLVCFRHNKEDGGLDSLQICNPLTGEYVLLQNLISYAESLRNMGRSNSIGFGYCLLTREYKVVRIYKRQGDDGYGHIQVYTVGGRWRYLGLCPYDLACSSGIYADGALHWFQLDRNSNYSGEILVFELDRETFHSIPLPEDVKDCSFRLLEDGNSTPFSEDVNDCRFKLLGDGNNLYLVCLRARFMDIFAFKRTNTSSPMEKSYEKQNYNDSKLWSWFKEFSIEYHPQCQYTFVPLAITRNNQLLLYQHQIFYCYDFKTSTMNTLWDSNRMRCWRVEVIPHVHGIVSLKDLGETHVRSYKTKTNREVTTLRKKVDYLIQW